MPPPTLGLLGIHDHFSYLFDFWVSISVDFGDPKVVNFTRKSSSIFSIPHSIRTLSSVFSPLSFHSLIFHLSLLFHM